MTNYTTNIIFDRPVFIYIILIKTALNRIKKLTKSLCTPSACYQTTFFAFSPNNITLFQPIRYSKVHKSNAVDRRRSCASSVRLLGYFELRTSRVLFVVLCVFCFHRLAMNVLLFNLCHLFDNSIAGARTLELNSVGVCILHNLFLHLVLFF